jgi:hypothetical protein
MDHSSWSERDRHQLAAHGLSIVEAERQLRLLRRLPAPLRLVRPCRLGDGILSLSPERYGDLERRCSEAAAADRLMLFLPASGAATRMFESLSWFVAQPTTLAAVERRAMGGDRTAASFLRFLAARRRFAFWPALAQLCRARGIDPETNDSEAARRFVSLLIDSPGLGYAGYPKGLIPFHREAGVVRTAFFEQLAEAAELMAHEPCRVHATIPPGSEADFSREVVQAREVLGRLFEVELSTQDPATDTLALDEAGEPFRNPDGSLLLRPGGHGALLANLEASRGDVVFIKNIDNILPRSARPRAVAWRRRLAGVLLEVQDELFGHLQRLEDPGCAGPAIEDAVDFARETLALAPRLSRESERRRAEIRRLLHRPLRVCGMVRNSGEPGGGPFWVGREDGTASRQIVESAQVDLNQPDQRSVWLAATYFNPVDLVCGLRDHRGQAYPLAESRDEQAVFIADKAVDSRRLRALEHPGLWNGGMAAWTTLFVEVPAETFAPVKSVVDLLRPQHEA